MRKIQFAEDQFYHIYNRGVEKRNIFNKEWDYSRFLTGLAEFNTIKPVDLKLLFDEKYKNWPSTPVKSKAWKEGGGFVKIHAFCLMPNHYHLLLEQIRDGGISAFMHKLAVGYSMYVNKKYERVGPLFQGAFKAILIEDETYLTHLLRYIHLNPVELVESKWKKNGISNWKKAMNFLESYKWSSFHDYNGKSTYPNIVTNKFLMDLFGGVKGHREFLQAWLLKDIDKIQDLMLE